MKRQQRIFLNKLLAIMLAVLMALPMNTIAWAADFSDGTEVTEETVVETVDDIFGDGSNSSTEVEVQNDTTSGNEEISTVDFFSSEENVDTVENEGISVLADDTETVTPDAYIDVKDNKYIAYNELYTKLVSIYGKNPESYKGTWVTYGGDFLVSSTQLDETLKSTRGSTISDTISIKNSSSSSFELDTNGYYIWRCTSANIVNTREYSERKYIQFRTYYDISVAMKEGYPEGAGFNSSDIPSTIYDGNSFSLIINQVKDYNVRVYDGNNNLVYSTDYDENSVTTTFEYTPTTSTNLTIEYVKAGTPKHEVSLKINGESYGTASLTSSGELEEGTAVTLTATPELELDGYISAISIGDTTLNLNEIEFNANRGISYSFTVGNSDINVTVTFAKKVLVAKTEIGTVGFNTKKSVSDQLDTLKQNIFNAVVDTDSSLPSGLTYSELTYKYRPVGTISSNLYDAIELTGSKDLTYSFGKRGLDKEETVVLTWPGNSQYPEVSIEAKITLVENREKAEITYIEPATVEYSTVEEIDNAVKNAVSTNSTGKITITRISDLTVSTEETTVTYKVSVAESDDYLANETQVTIKVKAKANPATFDINVVGDGTVTFADSSETSGTLIAGEYSIVAKPTNDKGYVASITINDSDISNDNTKYSNRTFSDSITIENEKNYIIVVTFEERTIVANDPIKEVGMNGYLNPSDQKETLKTNIFNAVVNSSKPSGIIVDDVKVEFYQNGIDGRFAGYVDIENDTLNLWNIAFDIGTEKVKITWQKTDRYPEVSIEAEITVVESRPTVTITPTSDVTLKVKTRDAVTAEAVKELLKDSVVVDSNDTPIAFSNVTVTLDDNYILPAEGKTNELTVTLTLAGTADYQAASVTTQIKVKNFVDQNKNNVDDDDEEKYTVTYVSGTEDTVTGMPEKQTNILSGVTVNVDNAVPTRTSSEEEKTYSFVKWVSADVTIENGSFTMPENDVTLTAEWSEDQYVTVTFMDGEKAVHTTRINVSKEETISSYEYDKENAVLSGWYTDVDCTTEYTFGKTPNEDVTLYAGWLADENNNNITDKNETATIIVNNETPENGTITVTGTNAIITANDTGYTIVYDSTVEGGNVVAIEAITTTATTTAEKYGVETFTVDESDVKESNPYSLFVANDETHTVNVKFTYEELKLTTEAIIYVNKYLRMEVNDRIEGLKEKILEAVVSEYGNASDYEVTVKGIVNDYNLDDLKSFEKTAVSTLLLGDSITVIITDTTTELYGTVTVTIKDSRKSVEITAADMTIRAESEEAYLATTEFETVKEAVEDSIKIVATDPATGITEPLEPASYTKWSSDYVWPQDGKEVTYTVTVTVSANATYAAEAKTTFEVKIVDTTPMQTIIYTDGTGAETYFDDQTYEIVADTEIPDFQDKDGNETTPIREYYVFDKWEESVSDDKSTITYTAIWKVEVDNNSNGLPDQTETYTVQYWAGYNNENEEPVLLHEESNLAYGANTPTIDAPSRDGYFFAGWSPEVESTVTAPSEGNTIIYTAQWNEKCIITFVYGNGEKDGSEAVEYNTTVKEPTAPTWTGHIFKYWYLEDEDTAYDFETPVTNSITLTAKWGDDRNNNGKEDGTEEDPFHYYIWTDGETELHKVDWLIGEAEITSEAYEYQPVANDGKAFVKWEESVSEDGYTTTYTAVLVADVNNNEIPDEEETITINVVKANEKDAISVSGEVKETASSTDEETSTITYSYVYDSKKDADISLVATPVTERDVNLTELITYKSVTYVDSVVITDASSSEEEVEVQEVAVQTANLGTYGDKYVYTYTFTPENGQTATVTFKVAEFDLKAEEERLMSYYYGQKDVKNEDVYNAIANAPAYADADEVTITYKAREEMSHTINLVNLIDTGNDLLDTTIKTMLSTIGYETIDIDMDEVWQNVNVETDADAIADSVSLDDAVSRYFTEATVNDLYTTYQAAYDAYLEENGTAIWNYPLAIAAGTAAITEKIESIKADIEAAAYYYNAHNFGYNPTDAETVTEEIKITYKSPAMYIETETTLKLKDTREASYIKGNNVSLTYKDYLDEELIEELGISVTNAAGDVIDGANVYSLSIQDSYTFEGKNVSDTAYEITFKFAGNETYKPSEATFEITIVKATAEMDLPEINVTYGTAYDTTPTVTLGNRFGTASDITDDMIQFLVGLDVADLSVSENGVSGLNSKIQIFLSEELQSSLDIILKALGTTNEDGGIELSLSSLMEALEYINFDSLEVLQQILDALEEIVDLGKLTIVIGGKYPTDIGVYLYGAVSTNSNYETAYDVSYILITPNAEQVYLDWDYNDSNGVFTHELLQYVDFSASAYDDEELTQKNVDATEKVQSLIFGLDANGELVVELNKTSDLANGAYTQLAFIAEFGNEFHYAVPIVRAFAIIPNVVNVEIVDTEGKSFKRTFDNEAQEVDVELTYDGSAIEVNKENLKVTYTGVQTNGATYNIDEAPTHAGVYIVTATYIHKDENDNIIAVGMDVQPMIVMLADAEVTVDSEVLVYDEKERSYSDYIHVTTNSGANPDVTIISASVASTGDFSENGWDAVEGSVNIDFPNWIDKLLEKEGMSDGVNAEALIAYLGTIEEDVLVKIEALDVSDSVISSLISAVKETVSSIVSVLEQMPEDVTLTFEDDVKFSDIGAYAVVAIVTDSDHTPAIDAGVIVVIPEVTTYTLKWNYEDENGIWTRELFDLRDVDLYATAYDAETDELDVDATENIQYQFFGFDTEGNFVTTNDASKLPNGVFTEMAYIPLEADADMQLSDVLVRVVTITPGVVDIQFVEGDEEITSSIVKFDNTEKALDVKVSISGEAFEQKEGALTVTYYGMQTNGEIYNSTEAPKHAGAYVVTAEYKEYTDNDDLKYYGVAAATLVIKPVNSNIEIKDAEMEYDGEGHTLEVTATSETVENFAPDYTLISGHVDVSGAMDTIGVEAFTANVNIDFPTWFDEVLADYEWKQDGITPAYLQKVMKDYKEEIFASISESILEKVGVEADTIESMEEVYDQIIELLGKMPESISITFEDDITYTEPGYYLYYGIVTDSDHMPSTDSGVLEITKIHYRYGILDTYVPYNGKGQEPYKISETVDGESLETDSFTMIIDRKTNTVNLLLEDDLSYVVDELEKLTGLDIKAGISLEALYEKVDVETLVNLLLTAIEGIEGNIDEESDLYAMVELLKTELNKLPKEGSIVFDQPLPVNAGEYEFYTIAYAEYYETQVSQAVLTIMPIYITAEDADKEKVYGEEDPDLTEGVTYSYYSYAGGEWKYFNNYNETKIAWVDVAEDFDIVNDKNFDNKEVVTLPEDVNIADLVEVEVVRTEGEDVGIYDMTLSLTLKDESGNYVVGEFVQDDQDFEIKPADITITVADAEKVYGETDPTFTYEITEGKLVNGDDFTFELTREASEDVGTYPITVVTEDEDGKVLYPNYNITVVKGTLTVTQKPVTITVKDAYKTYGDTDPEGFEYEVGETAFEDEITVTPTRAVGEDVGTYKISVSEEQCDNYKNYDITVTDATFTINKRNVIVTINDASKYYGDADPEGYARYEVDDLVGSDKLEVTITRKNSEVENVGKYPEVLVADKDVINNNKANKNYNVTEVVPGDFEILTRTVTIVSIEPVDRVYEKENKTINVKVTVKGLDSEKPDEEVVIDATANIKRDNAAIYTGIQNLVLENENLKYEKNEALVDMLLDATVEIYPVKVVAALSDEVKKKEYDGTRDIVIEKDKVLSLTAAENQGLEEGYSLPEDLVVTYDWGGYENEDAGATKVGVVAKLTKAENSTLNLLNYALVEMVIKDDATITPCKVTVEGLEAVERGYEAGKTDVEIATENAVLVKANSKDEETSNTSAIVDGDDVDFTVTGSLSDPTEGADHTGADDAGNNKKVYLTMELTGRDKGNYELVVPEDLTVNINKLVIDSVSLGELERPSRGKTPQKEITVPEDVKYTASLSWKDGEDKDLSDEDTFAVDKTYTAEVELSLTDSTNYEFADALEVEDWTATVNADGTVTLTKEFSINAANVEARSIEKKSDEQGIGIIEVVNASDETNESYYTGDVVTVTAKMDENIVYKFKGWYAGTKDAPDYDARLSANAEYTFTVEEDTYLWGVYEAVEKVSLIIHGPEFTVSTPNADAVQKNEYIAYYDIGTRITVEGVFEGGEFLYWKNDSEKIASTSESYTFTIVRNTVLNVVYNTEEQPSAKVEFINDTNQVLSVASYTVNEKIERPLIQPSKVGYTFTRWNMTDEEIWNAIEEGETWIRVEPEFERLEDKYSVTVIYDSAKTESDDVQIGEKYTVIAKDIDNKQFSHWSDTEDGSNVISTSQSYTFIVAGAKTLYAIYVGIDEEVVQRPTIVVDTVSIMTNPNKIIYSITRNIPEGYDLLQHGAIYSTSDRYAKDDADETMIDGAESIVIKTSTDFAKSGIFDLKLTIREESLEKTIYVRGYMYVYNQSTGLYEVIYSDIVQGSYDDYLSVK